MAVVAIPRVISAQKPYYQDATEADLVRVGGLARTGTGTGSLYEDAVTTTIGIGGGAANTAINLGKAANYVRALGALRVGQATATAEGSLAAGDGTRSMTYSPGANTLTFAGGTGYVAAASGQIMQLGTLGPQEVLLINNATVRWKLGTSGNFLAQTDNTLDIGASGSSRPRTVYARTSLVAVGATNNLSMADGSLTQSSGNLVVAATAGVLQLRSGGANALEFNTNGAVRWNVTSAGHLTTGSNDNTLDIGAGGSERPRTVYVRTSLVAQGATNSVALADSSLTQTGGVFSVVTTAGALNLQAGGANSVVVSTNGSPRWSFDSTGNLITTGSDNAVDIGATGATRPRRVYVGTEVVVGNTVTLGTATISGSVDLDVTATGVVTVKGNPLPHLLNTAVGVDLTTGAKTVIYTVPTGKKLVVTGVLVRVTTGIGTVSDADLGVGTNVNADNIIPSTTLTGMATTDDAELLIPTGSYVLADAGQDVSIEVDIPAGASLLEADVDLLGYLV